MIKNPLPKGRCRSAMAAAVLTVAPVLAEPILAPGDVIIPFDYDFTDVSASGYPTNEAPRWAFDGAVETKYRNLGGLNTGFIVTPGVPDVVRSFVITTANDRVQEDPAGWKLYGTDDPIESLDNSTGLRENWTLIGQGALSLPAGRFAAGAPVNVTGSTAYLAYKIIFTAAKNDPEPATAIQFAEIQFFSEAGGGGTPLLAPTDIALAVQEPMPAAPSSYPGNETPFHGIDGSIDTKYLNFGKQGSGIIVTPTAGATTLRSFQLVTANDAEPRDPSSYEIYGTNEEILSGDNSDGEGEAWTLIQGGSLALPAARKADGELIEVTGAVSYKSYRIVFPTVKNSGSANSMQIAEIRLFSDAFGSEPILAGDETPLAVVVPASNSRYTNTSVYNEGPLRVLDQRTDTKYLNTSFNHAGFIVTPASGPAVVRSMVLTTANDAPDRDPSGWILYGTNDPIASQDNGNGEAEAWTLVAQGNLDLPAERFAESGPIDFTNTTAYASWKLVFPSVKNPGQALMQIAEVQFHTGAGGTGTAVLAPRDLALAIQAPHGSSSSPAAEAAANVLDENSATKYLNFGGINSGFIVTPAFGPSIVTGLTVTTANDFPGRDPMGWELYGTNETILSFPHSTGDLENWTLISSGDLFLPDDRFTAGDPVEFDNGTAYISYRFVVTSLKGAEPLMQFADIQFEGAAGTVAPPADANFRITAILRPNAGEVALTWNSEPGAAYRIAYSTSLSNWGAGTAVASVPSGGASTSHVFAIPAAVASSPHVYFRVEKN